MRLAFLTAVLAGTAFAAGAVPAFTADSGSVVGTVRVPTPPAPCITLSGTAVDFGTLPFSDPAAVSTPNVDGSPSLALASCATAPEIVSLAATDATTASGATWAVADAVRQNTCQAGLNVYMPNYRTSGPFLGAGQLYRDVRRSLPVFAPGGGTTLTYQIQMPCRGSAGAGGSATMTFSLLALIA